MAPVNELLRRHGFALLVLLGLALVIYGAVTDAVIIGMGVVVVIIGAIAVVPRRMSVLGTGVEWPDMMRRAEKRLQEKIEQQASGDVVVRPETARLEVKAFPPTVTVEPVPPDRLDQVRTPEDFVDAVVDSIRISATGSWAQPPASWSADATVRDPDAPDSEATDPEPS